LTVKPYALHLALMIDTVVLSKTARKALRKCPKHIAVKLAYWISQVGHLGLEEVRKIPGYHDEPLAGDYKGKRSIRLSLSYRAIYTVENGVVEFVLIEDVNKHYGD